MGGHKWLFEIQNTAVMEVLTQAETQIAFWLGDKDCFWEREGGYTNRRKGSPRVLISEGRNLYRSRSANIVILIIKKVSNFQSRHLTNSRLWYTVALCPAQVSLPTFDTKKAWGVRRTRQFPWDGSSDSILKRLCLYPFFTEWTCYR